MALALALIGLAELSLRAVEPWLSVDIQHHQTFDQRAQRLATSDGLRVAVVGNSMVRRGLDAEAWVASSQQAGAPQLSVEQFHPDDAGIGDWPWLLHRVFAARDRVPDVFILCMGPWVMGDDAEVHPTRIGRFYLDPMALGPDWAWAMVPAWEDRADVGLGWASRLVANRERVQLRVLDALVPRYRVLRRAINAGPERPSVSVGEPVRPTYQWATKTVRQMRDTGARVVVVSMPTRSVEPLDPRLTAALESAGAEVIDLGVVEGLDVQSHFLDGIHLNPDGRAVFSPVFGRSVAEVLSTP